jgi:hypothetical protein
MWKDVCHKCGRKIWNGIPEEEMEKANHNTNDFIKKMESEGYTLGRNSKIVGTWGNMREIPCEPICTICSNEESKNKEEKEKKKAMQKVTKLLKKQFTCPVCEYSQKMGYNTNVFKCNNKQEMISHIKEKHDLKEIEDIVPRSIDEY